MAARSVGSLFIDIEARTAKLEADLARTRGILQRMNSTVGTMGRGFNQAFSLAKSAVAAFAAVQLFKSVERMTLGTLEAMRAQIQLSEATNLTVNDLKAYDEASEHLGVSNLNLAKTMKELFALQQAGADGNKEATKEIKQMGFAVEDFGALRPAALFEGAVEGISRIKDASQRAALAQKVFGREAVNLSTLLVEGKDAINAARTEMERLGQTMDSFDTARVKVAMGAVAELGDRWEVFKQRLTLALTPKIFAGATFLAELLGSIDVEELANKIASWTVAIYSFLTSIPERVSIIFKQVQVSWYQFMSSLADSDFTGFLGRLLGTSEESGAKIEQLKSEIEELAASVEASGQATASEFEKRVQAILEAARKIGPVVKTTTSGISEGMRIMRDSLIDSLGGATDAIADFIVDGEDRFGDFFRSIVKTMLSLFLKLSLLNPLMNAAFGLSGTTAALPTMGLARGGPFMAGDTALVGENGPEVVTFGRSGRVTPNDRLSNMNGSSGGGLAVNITQQFQTGMTRAEFANAVPSIIAQTKAAVADAVMRGGGFRRAVSGS